MTGWLPKKNSAEPRPTARIQAPVIRASVVVNGDDGRSIVRARQSRRPAPTSATANASIIETCVRRPSKLWVTARIGIRSSAGNGPWYM